MSQNDWGGCCLARVRCALVCYVDGGDCIGGRLVIVIVVVYLRWVVYVGGGVGRVVGGGDVP